MIFETEVWAYDLARLAGFEPATRCLEGTANAAGMVRDVRFCGTGDPLSTGIVLQPDFVILRRGGAGRGTATV